MKYSKNITIQEKMIDRSAQKLNNLHFISALSDEKKQELSKAFQELSKCKAINDKIRSLKYPAAYLSDEEISFAVERLVEEGIITESDLQKIFLLLNEVETKGLSGEYTLEYNGRGLHLYMINVMKWFITNVYKRGEELTQYSYELDCQSDNKALKRTKN